MQENETATIRQPLSKRTRFEVLKRDKFTCRYCGSKAPDVVLHVDHIKPVALGGSNDPLNLVTACQGCNGGKSAIPLDNHQAVAASREEAERRQEVANQVEELAQWHKELADVDHKMAAMINGVLGPRFGFVINNTTCINRLIKLIKKHGVDRFRESVDGTERWLESAKGTGEPEDVFKKIERLMAFAPPEQCPKSGAAYLSGIARNRFGYSWSALSQFRKVMEAILLGGGSFTEWKARVAFAESYEKLDDQVWEALGYSSTPYPPPNPPTP